ncbi:DUF1173 family protein [Streptomyces johnsoniae]|uniref:DUF1173 family protein n=1 Tax=Streptomyces johnsoniae TaxID=3075532 RepID=A0ABU2SDD3_9ACTN|nr:DUF1173 family protein [Streptomyces sp. DSM 41886]MDT0446808.1 DUF1173 family protein [Streptomyces sp. DSM 41886]
MGPAGLLVLIADRTVPATAARESPGRYARLLGRAKTEVGHAACLCRTPPLRLVIRVRSGRHHLAGWPGEGHEHAPSCPFHKMHPTLSGRSHYAEEAIRENEEGTAVRLATPLLTRQDARRKPSAPSPTTTDSGASSSRRTVGLLGLMHHLWESAGLTHWQPTWHRTWPTCHARLREQTDGCTVNGQRDVLYVVPPYRPANAATNAASFAAFHNRLGRRRTHERRGLILGEIREITKTRQGERLALCHLRGGLFSSARLAERTRRSYRAAFAGTPAERAEHSARRIVLAVVTRSTKGYLVVEDIAVMLTTTRYIPADSSHEVRMADALTAAGHSFVKPLRYDVRADVFPDFVVTTNPRRPVYVEVYGMAGLASYRERKRTKQAHYRARGIPVLEWDTTEPMPRLTR